MTPTSNAVVFRAARPARRRFVPDTRYRTCVHDQTITRLVNSLHTPLN